MKLFQLCSVVIAQQQVSYDKCPVLEKPAGVADINCSGTKCAIVCEAGKVPDGKKTARCFESKKKGFFWKEELPECKAENNQDSEDKPTCTEAKSDDKDVKFKCKTNKKGKTKCTVKCKNKKLLTTADIEEVFKSVKMMCACKKSVCNWKVFQETIDPMDMYCMGSTTRPTSMTSTGTGSTTKSTTIKTTTPIVTTGTRTSKDTTTSKMTTSKPTTTSKATTTKATTTQESTTSNASVQCTPNDNGTCGAANELESYLFVNFEGETLTNNQVALDPRLCHLDHIGNKSYVGVGNGLTSFSSSQKSQAVATRVDVCDNLSMYADPTSVELGVPSGSPACRRDYTWVYKGPSDKHSMFGMVATSPDKTYVLAAGVKEKNNNAHARWIVKLDANTGAEIWSIEMPTGNKDGLSKNKQSGYESVAFTSDGGFIVGGWANHEGGWPAFKSGGQVEFGNPLFQKFSAEVAKQNKKFSKPPTPVWTFKCDSNICDRQTVGSMKTMRVFMDNGVEKVVSSPGTGAAVIVVNAVDGTKSAFKKFNFSGSFQDVEPITEAGKVTGYAVTGLDSSVTVPKGTGGCIKNDGCGTIYGHVSLIKPDLSGMKWSTNFNDFSGGTDNYENLTPLSNAVVITECWGLTATKDSQGNTLGFAAACGQGIEGCREYLVGIDESTLNKCDKDPRRTWRGTAVHVDTSGTMTWYRNDNERAYEFVDRGEDGKLVFLSDKPIGFGFSTLKN